jgi:uncharacterized membrane protein
MSAATSRLTSFRNAFFSGLLLLAPLAVTFWAFLKVIDLAGSAFGPRLATLAEKYLPESLAVIAKLSLVWDLLGTLIVVLLVALLGYVSRYVFGKYLLGVGDRLMHEIPGVSAVYSTVKQIVATFGRQGQSSFSKVVLVQFPRAGTWSVGFLTNTAPGEPAAIAGGDLWAVFVPTTPNPTSGFLVLVPSAEVRVLTMSVGDGMKLIISGGSIVPPWPNEKPATSTPPAVQAK